ncbi:MAG: protein kinase [archaeon]|nr:protein kinase [archaeon]
MGMEGLRTGAEDLKKTLGSVPLITAASLGQLSAVEALLAAGACADASVKNGVTALHAAASGGHLAVVERLLVAGANLHAPAADGSTALHLAARHGHVKVVQTLLVAGGGVEAAAGDGSTALLLASRGGHDAVVETLLAAGANARAALFGGVESGGDTALLLAARGGHVAVVERLLSEGALEDVQKRDAAGETPLLAACREGRLPVVDALLAAGADREMGAGRDGATGLLLAAERGHHAIVDTLLAAGAAVDAARDDGATALFVAAQKGRHLVAKTLLAGGADRERLCGSMRAVDVAKAQQQGVVVCLLSKPLSPRSVLSFQTRCFAIRQRLSCLQSRHELRLQQATHARLNRQSLNDVPTLALLALLPPLTSSSLHPSDSGASSFGSTSDVNNTNGGNLESQTPLLKAKPIIGFDVDTEHLQIHPEPFAHGSFGAIYRGTYHGTAVAVKYLMGLANAEAYQQEVRMWCKLRHPNVLQLLGLSMDPPRPLILMELMDGSLFDLLHNPKEDLTWKRRVKLAHGIAAGLSYIHAQAAVHRDIKSLNVLVRGKEVKIADFGATRGVASVLHTQSKAGTLPWLAPELYIDAPVTPAVDVYAFAVVMFELLSRKVPWQELSSAAALQAAVLGGRRPALIPSLAPSVSPEVVSPFIQLMQECWHQTPENRPSMAAVSARLTEMLVHACSSCGFPPPGCPEHVKPVPVAMYSFFDPSTGAPSTPPSFSH